MYSGLDGVANLLTVVRTTIDMAAVGPDNGWNDEPKDAAMTTGTIAE